MGLSGSWPGVMPNISMLPWSKAALIWLCASVVESFQKLIGRPLSPTPRNEQALVLGQPSLFSHALKVLRVGFEKTVADQKHVGHGLDTGHSKRTQHQENVLNRHQAIFIDIHRTTRNLIAPGTGPIIIQRLGTVIQSVEVGAPHEGRIARPRATDRRKHAGTIVDIGIWIVVASPHISASRHIEKDRGKTHILGHLRSMESLWNR